MRKQNVSIGLFILLFSFTTVMAGENVKGQVRQLLQTETLKRADAALESVPMTVTATRAERSAGGIHDFYSEGDYWWENPQNPAGPFIRRDGETNPDNFTAHRHAMIRFSQLVGDLTSAWILTGDKKYTDAAMRHIRAWFIDQKTMMNPNLLYAQAIKGIATGRGIGIIDTIHLIEVAQSLRLMEAQGIIEDKEDVVVKAVKEAGLEVLEVSAEKKNLEQVFVKLVNQKTKHSSLEDLLSEMDEEAAQKSGDAPADGADTPAADADTADSTQKEEE